MSFFSWIPWALIGSGELSHNHKRGNGESSKLKKLKHQELDEFSRSHLQAVLAAAGPALPLQLWAAYGHLDMN